MTSKNLTHGLFCDELEVPKKENHSLTLYFFGILVKAEDIEEIEKQILNVIAKLGAVSFHSIKHYKNEANWDIFEKFNDIIIKNNLEILCFPFVKNWLKLDEFKVINSLSLPEWKKFPINNYRAKAFYLFLHVLNHYLSKNKNDNTYVRVIIEKDWLKINESIEHQGIVLNKIEKIFSTHQKTIPLLSLSDHVAYLFNKIKKSTYSKEQKPNSTKEIGNDKFSKMSCEVYLKFCESKLFNFLDLKEWTKYENSKYQ